MDETERVFETPLGARDGAGKEDTGDALAAGLEKGKGQRFSEGGAELHKMSQAAPLRQQGPARESGQPRPGRPDP